MILAGEEGSRLYPLTQQRAKPAVPFGGKYRLIDITRSNSGPGKTEGDWVQRKTETPKTYPRETR